ncbi:MAG TPA: acyl carrier protein [Myxococcota bacterium]|nr:acyl carrier protein [Myxococcota bacterium]
MTKDRNGGAAADAEPQAIADALRRYLVELSEERLSYGEIDPERHLFDHGYVDSLSAVMLLAHIEERWGVQIEDVELIESLTSVNALAARIHSAR